jgi:hypothetical protein
MDNAPKYAYNYTVSYYYVGDGHAMIGSDEIPSERLNASLQNIPNVDAKFFEVEPGTFAALDVTDDLDWALMALSISYPQTLLVVLVRGEHDLDLEQRYYYQGHQQVNRFDLSWFGAPVWEKLDPEEEWIIT